MTDVYVAKIEKSRSRGRVPQHPHADHLTTVLKVQARCRKYGGFLLYASVSLLPTPPC